MQLVLIGLAAFDEAADRFDQKFVLFRIDDEASGCFQRIGQFFRLLQVGEQRNGYIETLQPVHKFHPGWRRPVPGRQKESEQERHYPAHV